MNDKLRLIEEMIWKFKIVMALSVWVMNMELVLYLFELNALWNDIEMSDVVDC